MAEKQRKKVSLDDLRPKSTRMYIKHPGTGEETSAYFDVIGQDSKEVRKIFNDIVRERQKSNKEPDFDQLQNEDVKIMAATVKGWDEETFGPYSQEAVIELLSDPEFMPIREQLSAFTEERKNFFRTGCK